MEFKDFIGVQDYSAKYCKNRSYDAVFHLFGNDLCIEGRHKGNNSLNERIDIPLDRLNKGSVIRAVHRVVSER